MYVKPLERVNTEGCHVNTLVNTCIQKLNEHTREHNPLVNTKTSQVFLFPRKKIIFEGFVPASRRYLTGIRPTIPKTLRGYLACKIHSSFPHILDDFYQSFFLFGHFLICIFLCLKVAQVIPPVNTSMNPCITVDLGHSENRDPRTASGFLKVS